MLDRPQPALDPVERAKAEPRTPAERLAVALRVRIVAGELPLGSELPPMKELAADNQLAVSTVHRAVAMPKAWGLVEATRGRRARILEPGYELPPEPSPQPDAQETESRELLDLEIRYRGQEFRRLSARGDPRNAEALHRLLAGVLRRAGLDEAAIGEYEMDVRIGDRLITTFVDAG